eukprot:1297029-Amphidinium_carterae.1
MKSPGASCASQRDPASAQLACAASSTQIVTGISTLSPTPARSSLARLQQVKHHLESGTPYNFHSC